MRETIMSGVDWYCNYAHHLLMGWRFQRRSRIFPGLRLNVSKSGVSASIGTRGAWLTLGRGNVRTMVGLPGTAISYSASAG